MGFKLKLTLVLLLIFSQFPMHSAMAEELSKWIPYGEDIGGDSSPKRIDIVGDEVYPAVFYYSDSEYIYFRMRVNENPRGPNGFGQFAWTVVFNTDTKIEDWEYMLTVNGKDERVELWKNGGEKKKGNGWNTEEDFQLWSGPASQYAKIEEAETSFDNDQDYFIDWKISLSTFTDFTKIDINTPFRMFFVTSASTNNKNFFDGDIVGGEAPVTLNRAPTIKEFSKVEMDKNTFAEGIVEANDPDGDALNYMISAQGAHGIAEIIGTNKWKYSPEKDYVGEDSFTITVSDGKGGIVSAEVKIQVNEVDVEEPPVVPDNPPVEPGTPPVDPGTPPVDPGTPPVEPGTPPVDPGTPPVEPGTPPVEPGTSPVDPGTPPGDTETQPEETKTPPVSPENPPVNPETPSTETNVSTETGYKENAGKLPYTKVETTALKKLPKTGEGLPVKNIIDFGIAGLLACLLLLTLRRNGKKQGL